MDEFKLPKLSVSTGLALAGVALGVLQLMTPAKPALPPLTVPNGRRGYAGILDAAAAKYGVPAALVRAVAYVESRWNPLAKSPVGAVGIMQLMPSTAEGLGVKDRTNPVQNADGGAKLLASLYKRAGSWPVALAAYNWGQGNVFGTADKPPRMYSSQWPPSTQNYVKEVLEARDRGVS